MSCEGYGTNTGVNGGYAEEDYGWGHPCAIEGWFIIAVLEEALASSYASEISVSGVGSNKVREDGGDLVVVGSTGPLSGGPYQVSVRPTGGSILRAAYSGVLGQGTSIIPELTNNRFSFVAPHAVVTGSADVIIDRPGGQVIVLALLNYVPYSQRSGTRLLRSFMPGHTHKGSYEPTVP